jgi:outer membrane translocation and assembly module TamA
LRNFFTFNRLNGVIFYDAGLPWNRQIDMGRIVSDVGVGLRVEVTVLGFFEKATNRIDIAVPLESPHDVHAWFEVTHAF